jgi:MIR domain
MLRNEKDELLISFQRLGMLQEEFEGNSNGMWQLEGETMMKGGSLEWDKPFRMRHLSIGKYLAIHDKPLNDKEQFLLYLSDTPSPNTLFQIT